MASMHALAALTVRAAITTSSSTDQAAATATRACYGRSSTQVCVYKRKNLPPGAGRCCALTALKPPRHQLSLSGCLNISTRAFRKKTFLKVRRLRKAFDWASEQRSSFLLSDVVRGPRVHLTVVICRSGSDWNSSCAIALPAPIASSSSFGLGRADPCMQCSLNYKLPSCIACGRGMKRAWPTSPYPVLAAKSTAAKPPWFLPGKPLALLLPFLYFIYHILLRNEKYLWKICVRDWDLSGLYWGFRTTTK